MRLSYGPAPSQFGDLVYPPGSGPYPVVVVIHGGFWMSTYGLESTEDIAHSLMEAGLAAWNIEYRRVGNPGGGFPGTFFDVGRAVDYVREIALSHPVDSARVLVMGHSAGGHLALWAAGRHRIPVSSSLYMAKPLIPCAAFAIAGIPDLLLGWEQQVGDDVIEALMGGSPNRVPQNYAAASASKLVPLGIPITLVHGSQDEAIPVSMSQAFRSRAAAEGDDVTLVLLNGAGHFDVLDSFSKEWATVKTLILKFWNMI